MMPSQNAGADWPISANTMAAPSNTVLRRTAEMTPTGIAIDERKDERRDRKLDGRGQSLQHERQRGLLEAPGACRNRRAADCRRNR